MSGTLSSLNNALTALQYQRVVMDVASANIANATTEGYTRRRVNGETIGPSAIPAVWSRQDSSGSGVKATSVARINDAVLDVRVRREHATQAYLDLRAEALTRVETGLGEPGDKGVAAALTDFRTSWQDVKNSPGSEAARSQVLAKAQSLLGSIRGQSANIDGEVADQQARLTATVTEVNTLAEQLAETNANVVAASLNGVDTTDLLDRRDALALRLSELAGGAVVLQPNGAADVTVGGHPLVAFDQRSPLDAATLPTGLSGELGAIQELLTTTLPGYQAGLDRVVAELADEVNALHQAAFDLDGNPGQAFFTYDPADPTGTLAVGVTDPRAIAVAATGGGGGNLDGSYAGRLAGATKAGEAYSALVNGFGSQVNSARGLAATQQLLTSQVDGARDQLAGVSLDEEMVAMLAAQRAYEAASQVMTVMDSVLDTLINRTGLLR